MRRGIRGLVGYEEGVHKIDAIAVTGKLPIELPELCRLHEPGAVLFPEPLAAPADDPLVPGKEQLVPKGCDLKEALLILLKAPSALLRHKSVEPVLPVQDFFLGTAVINCHLFYK